MERLGRATRLRRGYGVLSMAKDWDHDLGGVFSGRALREQPRYNSYAYFVPAPSCLSKRANHFR